MSEMASFNAFGTDFQEKTFQSLIFDHKFAEQMTEVIEPHYFDLKYLQFLADRCFKYFKKYKGHFPSFENVVMIVKEDLMQENDKALQEQVFTYLKKIKSNPHPGDLPYIKEKSLEFCKKQKFKLVLEKSIEHMQAEKYEIIVEEVKKAAMVGIAPNLGHDFFADYESRFLAMKRNCIPTGLEQLDALLNGGLGSGELSCVVASSGVGKSHFLVMLGANAMRMGKNVVHYTFELSENNVGLRYDSNLVDIDSNLVIESKDTVIKHYEANQKSLGGLRIKYFPTGTATIYILRSHLERLKVSGFNPDMILVDYADLMRSSRQYDSPRFELKLLYEELRCLADEYGVPVVTASQSNKEGYNSDILDMTNMNESLGKAFTCDVIVTISRKSSEKASGWGRLFLAKNRAGRDGICHTIKIDTARSKFEIVGEISTLEEASAEEKKSQKSRLAEHWRSISKEVPLKAASLETEAPLETAVI